jgi:Predicted nucleic acid-binding protein, contains PIN domain
MYLLDSNICIYIINGRPQRVVQKIKEYNPPEIKLSSISIAELEYGVSKSENREKNRQALLHFASAFDIVDFTDDDAEIYGLIRADLEKKGQVIGPYDMQIAAQAISRNMVLVTNNVSEFCRVKNLKIENWAE